MSLDDDLDALEKATKALEQKPNITTAGRTQGKSMIAYLEIRSDFREELPKEHMEPYLKRFVDYCGRCLAVLTNANLPPHVLENYKGRFSWRKRFVKTILDEDYEAARALEAKEGPYPGVPVVNVI